MECPLCGQTGKLPENETHIECVACNFWFDTNKIKQAKEIALRKCVSYLKYATKRMYKHNRLMQKKTYQIGDYFNGQKKISIMR